MKRFSDQILHKILARSLLNRFLFFFFLDLVIMVISLYLSFLVYFDFAGNINYSALMLEVLPYFVLMKLVAFALFKVYRITWRYFGITDLFNVIMALVGAELMLLILSRVASSPGLQDFSPFLAPIAAFPRSVIFMDFTVCLVLLSFLRISKRFYLEVVRKKKPATRGKRAVIVGAGNTGEMILRDMARQNFSQFYPIGFLDDDAAKAGTYIHGVKVLGRVGMLEEAITDLEAEALVIAIPSLDRKALSNLYDSARRLKVGTIKIVPRIYDFNRPEIKLRALEDIAVEDLIGRQSVEIDYHAISAFLTDKRVLVTGAGGSIGSEISAQVCTFRPRSLILFDVDETELHNLGLRLHRLFPDMMDSVHFVTGDIRDRIRVDEVFGQHKPQIIFHSAAYKHVPMMEYNAGEAVKANLFGTYLVAKAAAENGADKFVMISTDKAVRPTSVMGATKRIAEYICRAFNHGGTTKFVAVRFGNVLGSRGSVLPLFLDQLKHGGPLTVTHKEMKRYFMTIPEAVSLVLQASVIGNGGEVLVLDMGEPVNIMDIAEELIRLHGFEPNKDVDIELTGLRPGEKLFEEILTAEEGTDASRHEKIFIARNGETYTMEQVNDMLKEFRGLLNNPCVGNGDKVKGLLRKYVKYYDDEQKVEAGTGA